jgi:pimeloyl-ACP methyl ester carboxylesterase
MLSTDGESASLAYPDLMIWRNIVAMTLATIAFAACASAEPVRLISSDTTVGTPQTESDDSSNSQESTEAPDPQTDDVVVPSIEWSPLGSATESAQFVVPLNYNDPNGDTISIYVVRHPARNQTERIGSLLVNPGGPGFGGSILAEYASQIYDTALLDRFDIVGWDPRGTGLSEPSIDCIDDYDPFFAEIDITPENDEEQRELVALAQEFADRCVSANDGIAQFSGTNNSARDMDMLRRALGEETISYFGFSYGSELGATWATLFPDTVRAAVLDGAADPNADSLESSLQQLEGFEASLSTFLEQCSSDPTCEFHNGGDAEAAFDELMASLDDSPASTSIGRPPANLTVAINGVIEAMYSDSYWPRLEIALAKAAAGDGAGLLALHDSYFQRQPDGSYGNELEAFQTISCADSADRLSVAEENSLIDEYREVAPRLVPEGASGQYFCTFFPAAQDPRIDITGDGAGPIVVIGTTGDPATPLSSTEAMANALDDGRLVVVEADQHTGYGVNQCIDDLVSDYLINLEAPKSGTECR